MQFSSLSSFGCEVSGLALWDPLDGPCIDELARAWAIQGVLVFRRQALSENELVDFSNRFGQTENKFVFTFVMFYLFLEGVLNRTLLSFGVCADLQNPNSVHFYAVPSRKSAHAPTRFIFPRR